MDLTTLSDDDTDERVRHLCRSARTPFTDRVRTALGEAGERVTTAAVCVYRNFVPTALDALEGSGVRVATVAGDFPGGGGPLGRRVAEVHAARSEGADEIDVVIAREHVLHDRWDALHHEVRAFREAAGDAVLKVILATGELPTATHVARAALVTMMAGADFVKTSTGKERVNATLPAGRIILQQIRAYEEWTGYSVGFKPAGGIRTAQDALEWLSLMREEMGPDRIRPELFRFGASSLLNDIQRELATRPGPGRAIN